MLLGKESVRKSTRRLVEKVGLGRMCNALLFGALCLSALSACGDIDPAFSPGYFWMWNGRLDVPTLISQLDDMHAHGLRSVCIHPFPTNFRRGIFESHMEPDYLTSEYLDVFAKVVKRARELGMDAWLYDEGGWPSGGACGLVASGDAEGRFRRRRLSIGADGKPTLVVEPYSGNPPYPSMIEKGAVDSFLSLTHDAYAKAIPDDIGKTVRFAFTDEPAMPRACDGSRTSVGWTADFDEVFRAKKGYDLRPHIKELLERKDDTDDRLAKLRIDYHEVRADLFMERYQLPIRDWCRAHGMIAGGHLNGEDVPERIAEYGHGDLLRSLRGMDCPGVDVIWKQIFPATAERGATTAPFPRYAASAMHQNGGRFAVSESFGIFGDGCTPDQMKWVVDYQMVRGINRFVFGYYALTNARQWQLLFEPHSGPVVPYWDYQPQFFRYIERTAAFLSQGRPGAEIAVFYDVRGLWAGGADKESAAQCHYAVATALDRMNRDYDFVNDESLSSAEVTDDGALKVGAMRYRALVLPTSKWMSDAAREKVDAFRRAGGLVTSGADLSRLPVTLAIRGQDAIQMRVMKRVDGRRNIYFVVNEDPWERDVKMDFCVDGAISRYDVEKDRLAAVPSDMGTVAWHFAGSGSAIFVTGADPELPIPAVYSEEPVLTLTNGWSSCRLVSHELENDDFVIHRLDEPFSPMELGNWQTRFGETFSGRAAYRIEFESPVSGQVKLDLGQVCWCAGVKLNGMDLGKRFFGPFTWEVELKKGRNVLEVEVANLLSSLLGDRATRERIAKAYPPNPNYEPRQGPGDLRNREGGLFGPVSFHERVPIPVSDSKSEAKWVFAGESLDDLPTNACLRLAFDVDRPVKRAWVHSFREKCWGIWLNGKPLNCTLWPDFKSFSGHVRGTGAEIGPLLKPGRNVLAIGCRRAATASRPHTRTCGVMLRGEVEFADGTRRTLVSTSRQIKASPVEEAGWKDVGFDDSHWAPGLEIGDATALPWSRYSDVMRQYATPEEYAAYQAFLKTGGGAFDEKGLLAEPASPNAKVVFSGRLPGIETNGRTIPPYAFMEVGLVPSRENDAIVLSARKAGIPIIGLSRFLRGKYEAEDGTYDFSQFDGGIRRILALYPEARFFLYYRNGAEMPVGWVKRHPDELVGYAIQAPGRTGYGDYSGNPPVPSFASKLYRDEERRFWKAFGDYARHQPWGRRILGVHCGFGGSGDGMPAGCNRMPDTGKRMTEAFRRYLFEKYPTDAALRASWGDPQVTRATATVPDRAERLGTGLFVRDLADARDRRVNDYYDCYTRELEDFMLSFGRSVKEALPGCLAGAYFGYTVLPYSPEGVTARYGRMLRSGDIDYFYATTVGYNLSDGFHRSLAERCRRYGKFCSIEGDVRPWNSRGFGGEEQWRCKTPEETRATFGKFVSNALVLGTGWQAVDFGPYQSGTGMWWHNCPEAMETMAAGVRAWRALWKNPGDGPNEIAVLFDPDSPWKNGHGDRDTTEVQVRNIADYALQSLTFTGYPFDLLSPCGYASSPAKYKAVVFLNTLTGSDELVRAAAKARSDRATAIWCYAPGLGGANGYDLATVRRLTGLVLSVKREPCAFNAKGPGLSLSRFATPVSWKDAPRLFVEDASADALATWTDDKTVAAASKIQADGSRSVFFGITPHESAVWAKLFQEAGATPVTEPGFYVARSGSLLEVFSGKDATLHGGLAVQRGQVSQSGSVDAFVGHGVSKTVDMLTGETFKATGGKIRLVAPGPKTWLLRIRE